MNVSSITLLFCIVSLVLIGCNEKNTRDIKVSGSITDNLSGQPIENASVTVLCWYDAGWDKTDYVIHKIVTDSTGSYVVTFEEGYKVIVASVAPEHKEAMHIVNNLKTSKIEVNLMLKQDSTSKRLSELDLEDYILSDTRSW
jgi:hypothetical protein